ncbi:MAG TPA: hypothetical protein VGM10_26085 [Actinocrinis sp.]
MAIVACIAALGTLVIPAALQADREAVSRPPGHARCTGGECQPEGVLRRVVLALLGQHRSEVQCRPRRVVLVPGRDDAPVPGHLGRLLTELAQNIGRSEFAARRQRAVRVARRSRLISSVRSRPITVPGQEPSQLVGGPLRQDRGGCVDDLLVQVSCTGHVAPLAARDGARVDSLELAPRIRVPVWRFATVLGLTLHYARRPVCGVRCLTGCDAKNADGA